MNLWQTYILLSIMTAVVWAFHREIKFLIRMALLILGFEIKEKK